jgi:hypothetical protein
LFDSHREGLDFPDAILAGTVLASSYVLLVQKSLERRIDYEETLVGPQRALLLGSLKTDSRLNATQLSESSEDSRSGDRCDLNRDVFPAGEEAVL